MIHSRRPARVAVLLNGRNAAHYLDNGREPYQGLESVTPWLRFEFYDERTFVDFQERVVNRSVHAIVLSSGVLDTQPLRDQVLDQAFAAPCRAALSDGLGCVVLHQHPPASGALDLTFLPDTVHVAISRRHADEHYVRPEDIDCPCPLTVAGSSRSGSAKGEAVDISRLTPGELAGALGQGQRGKTAWYRDRIALDEACWEIIAHERQNLDVLLARSSVPGISVAVSALPLDWNRSPLLASVIAHAARDRGCLFVRPEGGPPEAPTAVEKADMTTIEPFLQRLGDEGYFVHEQQVDEIALGDPACNLDACSLSPFFALVTVSTAWQLPQLSWLSNDEILTRLEHKGGLAICAPTGAGREMLIEIAEPPGYVREAEAFAEWLNLFLSEPDRASVFDLRTAVLAMDAIERAFRDSTAIPPGAARWHVERLVGPEIARLTPEGHVDTDPLRTACALAVATTLAQREVATRTRRWLATREPPGGPFTFERASPYELVQILVWNPELWDRELGQYFREHHPYWEAEPELDGRPHTMILQLQHQTAEPASLVARLSEAADSEALPMVVRGELLLALATLRSEQIDAATLYRTREYLARAKPWLRRAVREVVEDRNEAEAVGMLSAALVAIEKEEGLAIAGAQMPSELLRADAGRHLDQRKDQALIAAAERATGAVAAREASDRQAAELAVRIRTLQILVIVLAVVTWALFTSLAAVLLGTPALLGALFGLPSLYATLLAFGPRIIPGLSAMPGAKSAREPSGHSQDRPAPTHPVVG